MTQNESKRPAPLLIAEEVQEEPCAGHYDEDKKTWSDRAYQLAAAKKHNESM